MNETDNLSENFFEKKNLIEKYAAQQEESKDTYYQLYLTKESSRAINLSNVIVDSDSITVTSIIKEGKIIDDLIIVSGRGYETREGIFLKIPEQGFSIKFPFHSFHFSLIMKG